MRSATCAAVVVIAGGLFAPTALKAQPPTIWPDPPRPAQPSPWPEPPRPAAPAPAQPAAPAAAPAAPAAPAPPVRVAKPRPKKPPAPRAIACTGPFGQDSNHARLVAAFGAANVMFTKVDGPEGSKLDASVVYPKDPTRRLEVLWQDQGARAKPSAVVITGASRWLAPAGLKLGTPLAEVESKNGKPFKLSGFDWDYGGTVTDWDGGKLDGLAGGCRMGMRFIADAKIAEEARGKVAGDKPFGSDAADIRAVNPKISEIIVGYGS